MSEEKWIPKVRFGNFNKNWKKYLMSDVFDIKAGGDIEKEKVSKEKTIKNIYPIYANALKNEGLYGYTNTWKSEENTITVTARGALGYALPRYNKYYPIVRLLVLKPKIDSDIYFFSEAINRLTIFNEASGVPQLTAPQLRTYKLKFPLVHEQQKIGNLFKKLDQAISLQQQVLEATKEYKQSMLQKMFPKKGEKVPEIRFKEFEGIWSGRLLEEITDNYDRYRIPITEKDRISGSTPYYGSNGIQDFIEGYTHKGNFVLLAEDGANDIDNYPVRFVSGKIWVNNHAHVLKAKDNVDSYFLTYVL